MGTDSSSRILRGEAYEEFISGVYRRAVRLGAPNRVGLRADGLTDEEIDEGTQELMARGFLLPTESHDEWQVVPPRESISRFAERSEHRLRLARATAGELEGAWRRTLGKGVGTLPGLDLLGGIDDINGRIAAMHLAARDRLWWSIDGSVASRAMMARAVDKPDLLSVRPGVQWRLMFDTDLLEMPEAVSVMELAATSGASVRLGNGLPFSAVICDEDAALVDISSYDRQGIGSFEARNRPPMLAVASLVERMWTLGAPFEPMMDAARRREQGEASAPLDERDQGILALLASGASDQVIARRQGVSVRTVERRVRYIMEHLGAATRFHAGAQAVRRGWV